MTLEKGMGSLAGCTAVSTVPTTSLSHIVPHIMNRNEFLPTAMQE